MKLKDYQRHWAYYKSIEREFMLTNAYVMHTQENKNTYSDEFAKIILLSGSEIDSLFQLFFKYKNIEPAGKYYTIKDYAKIVEYDKVIKIAFFSFLGDSLRVTPFKDLDEKKAYANLYWWNAYQKIKHNRSENYKMATLDIAANCVAAHHKILRILLSIVDGGIKVGSNYDRRYYSDYWYKEDYY